MDFYKTHEVEAGEKGIEKVRFNVTQLNIAKKYRDVRAVLVGFLTYHADRAEPWMYEALALSIKMNKGDDKDVKTALGYAADLAVKTRNPNHLVSVADMMLLQGGPLLDQATELVPHRGEPMVMSINLARLTKDPVRMARSVDMLLSQGWPGMDEAVRDDATKQVEKLAKTLREEGRESEADTLLASLPDAKARDLFVRLRWVGDAGLDLAVEEPLGATACFATPRTVFGGSIVKDGYGNRPEDVYVCPRAFDGVYTIRVETAYNNDKKPATEATLEVITHEGTPEEHKEVHKIPLTKSPAPVKVTLTGGRRKRALPFVSVNAMIPPPAAKPKGALTAKGEAKTPQTGAKAKTGTANKR